MIPLLFALSLFANPADVPPGVAEDHLIILTGSDGEAETKRRLSELMKRWPASVHLPKGYPQILRSDSVSGLKPGFVIALAGACYRRADAVAVKNELNKVVPGVYVRTVNRYLAEFVPNCPRLVIKPGSLRKRAKVLARYRLEVEGPATTSGLNWKIYVADSKCGANVLVHLVDAQGGLVDKREEAAYCLEGDPEVDGSGVSKIWSAELMGVKGKAGNHVMFTYELWASDSGCSGGVALCPTPDGINEDPLEEQCESSRYRFDSPETYCRSSEDQ